MNIIGYFEILSSKPEPEIEFYKKVFDSLTLLAGLFY